MHLIEWDQLDLRIDGTKLGAMAREMVAADPMIERIDLRFSQGLLRVTGTVRKFISVPFAVEITRLEPVGTAVRVPLSRISAGLLPVPFLLLSLARDLFPKELVRYEDPATLVVSLDRFLPPFVKTEIRTIRIVDGGLTVQLGRGGADLPAGGMDESAVRE